MNWSMLEITLRILPLSVISKISEMEHQKDHWILPKTRSPKSHQKGGQTE